MRYRIDEFNAGQAAPAGDDMVIFTAVIGLLIGLVLAYVAKRGKQRWLLFWAGGLVLASITYLIAPMLGYQ